MIQQKRVKDSETTRVCWVELHFIYRKMNVRSVRQEQKIRRIDFGEHILGFRFGHYPTDQHLYRPFQYSSNTQRHKADDTPPNNMQTRHLKTSTGKRLSPDVAKIPLDHSREAEQDQNDFQLLDDNEQLKRQRQKHFQFIRSYQGWLQDQHIEGYQSARMTTTLGVKKGKSTDRSTARNTIEPKIYELQGNQYKQGNIFPRRNNSSIKRIRRKNNKLETKQPVKYQSQGQLRLKLIKNVVRSEMKPESSKKVQHHSQVRPSNRIGSALLRTFSNPKILSIENRQLVKGTKIPLL